MAGPVAHAGDFQAARTDRRIHLDGKLEEPEWALAPVYSSFVESFPREGGLPSLRTEVRVLYDNGHLYIGVDCLDDHPERIVAQLGRRDTLTAADRVTVIIDSNHDHRTAYAFSLNAAGVLRDELYFSDINSIEAWDAVWDGAAAVNAHGWSAEFEIPLNILRFGDAPEQTWGFFVERHVPRTHQIFESTLIPRNANARVSRFGHLTHLTRLKPKTDFEFAPYAAARLNWAPAYADPTRPHPRLLNPSGDLGADIRASLTSSLTLNAAINPDFGQVEADQVILNLQNFEPLFPEKRPFFTQGLDLFLPPGGEYGDLPNQLFYSRHVGLDAPILGAAKVTGSVRDGTDVGVLDAVVMGSNNPSQGPYYYSGFNTLSSADLRSRTDSAPRDRQFEFHPSEPLHFGLNNALPAARPVSINDFAAVVKQRLFGSSTIGLTLTSALPLAQECFPSDFRAPGGSLPAPAGSQLTTYSRDVCSVRGQNAAAVDWNLKSSDGQYTLLGVVHGSEQVGGPADGMTFFDGTRLRPGDLGAGGYAYAAKSGGEPWRFDVLYFYTSPKEDFNQIGYLPSQNQQRISGRIHFVKPTGLGQLRSFNVDASWASFLTTDGRLTRRGDYAGLNLQAMLPGFQTVGFSLNWDIPRFDVREIHYAGIPMQRQGNVNLTLFANTDATLPFFVDGAVYFIRLLGGGEAPYANGVGFDGRAVWRPQARLETQLLGSVVRQPQGIRYVGNPAGNQYVFGDQFPGFLSVTLRQSFVLSPKMTLQAYAQFFSDYVHYSRFFSVNRDSGQEVLLSDMRPFDYRAPADSHGTVLNLNVVYRWEYRLGSALFLVYSRSQSAFPGLNPPRDVRPYLLGSGPATDTVLVKWSYLWGV